MYPGFVPNCRRRKWPIIGSLALAFSAAFPEGASSLPGLVVIMGAIPVAVLGVSLVLGGAIRFAFPPLTGDSKQPQPVAKKRMKVSAKVLLGN